MRVPLSLYLTFMFLTILYASSVKAQESSSKGVIYLNEPDITFQDLISKFKGKIIYLDIWATWCMPCRKELELKKDVKAFAEFAEKNNIVVLYICCDKNGNSWKKYINTNELAGNHLLVNQQINEAFHTTFSVPKGHHGKRQSERAFFLPRHMIINQSGSVCDSAADRQGTASVYLKIKEILKK